MEVGKLSMIQVAHCLRVSGDIAKMNNRKLSNRDKAMLKNNMDAAFIN